MIGIYCYAQYSLVPTFNLSPNLLVEVATDYNYGPLTYIQRIQGYRARGCQFGVRDYLDIWTWWKDGPGGGIPFCDNVKLYGLYGAKYYNAESGDGWPGRVGLTAYLMSKVLWDIHTDLNAAQDKFFQKAFGPAANTMKSYSSMRGNRMLHIY